MACAIQGLAAITLTSPFVWDPTPQREVLCVVILAAAALPASALHLLLEQRHTQRQLDLKLAANGVYGNDSNNCHV